MHAITRERHHGIGSLAVKIETEIVGVYVCMVQFWFRMTQENVFIPIESCASSNSVVFLFFVFCLYYLLFFQSVYYIDVSKRQISLNCRQKFYVLNVK